MSSIADELERLQALKERGALSEEEYARAKAHVLGETAAGGGASVSGDGAAGGATAHRSFLQQLARSRTDRVIGGVCGGLGHHTGLPPWAWRVIFCITLLYFGAGVLIYLLLWIFIPQESLPTH